MARERRDVGAHAERGRVRTEVLLPFPDRDSDVRLAGVDSEVPSALGEVHQRADVTLLEWTCGNRVDARLRQLLRRPRQLAKSEDPCRLAQPRDVVLQP